MDTPRRTAPLRSLPNMNILKIFILAKIVVDRLGAYIV